MTRCRYGLLACLLALSVTAPAAFAEEVRPIDQESWTALKQKATLPNGETLAYVELGARDATPLVLIHGFTDNSRSWSLMAPYLTQRYRLIMVDLRGHGASAGPHCCYALADLADDVRLLMDALHVQKADIVGHSLGSLVAQTLAQSYPERVGKLVLISSTVSAGKIAGPGSWLWNGIHALRSPIDPDSQFMMAWYANPHPVDQDFLVRERRESAAVPVDVWIGIDTELARIDYRLMSTLIKAPVLIIWGKQDSLFSAADEALLRRTIKQAEFVSFDTGHNVMWEQPAQVAAEIDRFLAGAGADRNVRQK